MIILAILLSTYAANASLLGDLFGDNGNSYTGIFQPRSEQRSLFNGNRWANGNQGEYQACKTQYDGWLTDGVMDINLTIGYHDNSPRGTTQDRTSFAEVRALLMRNCNSVPGKICGFKWVANDFPDNITVLEKTFTSYDGTEKKIRFTLGYTSISNDDRRNIGSSGVISPQQEIYSANSEAQYYGAIANATCEVCGYLGHARNGGGPDFRPVPYAWRDSDQEPVYARYLESRTNYRRLLESVSMGAQRTRQLVVVMGCASKSHFFEQNICPVEEPGCRKVSLDDFAQSTGFMVSDLLSWPQNRDQYLGAILDTLTGLKCRSAIDQNLRGLRGLPKPEGYQILGSFLN